MYIFYLTLMRGHNTSHYAGASSPPACGIAPLKAIFGLESPVTILEVVHQGHKDYITTADPDSSSRWRLKERSMNGTSSVGLTLSALKSAIQTDLSSTESFGAYLRANRAPFQNLDQFRIEL